MTATNSTKPSPKTSATTAASTPPVTQPSPPPPTPSPPPPPPLDPIAQVFGWIISGAAEHEIIEAIDKLWPDAKPKPLIAAAMKRITAEADVDRATLMGWCIAATRAIYQRAVEAGDHAAALRAVKQLELIGRKVWRGHGFSDAFEMTETAGTP